MVAGTRWTIALFALAALAPAAARVFERCELARELRALGLAPDLVPTWVCIAFHESRFDTAAHNPHSGDHGLLQISELYWCGPAKACGVPCAALRDDDIRDDVQCALQVHHEHTALQGDGFLAWVVYPQHCKHNTKKYLADCDTALKNATVKTNEQTTDVTHNNTNMILNNIDESKNPRYLSVTSFIRGNYDYDAVQNYNNQKDWINYKIDNVDDLTLPVFTKIKSTSTTVIPKGKDSRVYSVNNLQTASYTSKPYTQKSNYFEQFTLTPKLYTEVVNKIPSKPLYSEPTTTKSTPTPSYIAYEKKISSAPPNLLSRHKSASSRFNLIPISPTHNTNIRYSIATAQNKISTFPTTSTAKPYSRTSTSVRFTYKPVVRVNTKESKVASPSRAYPTVNPIFASPKTSSPGAFTSRRVHVTPNWYSTRSTQPARESAKPSSGFGTTTTPRSPSSTLRTTRSIFDLYLNPTTRPTIVPYSFRPRDSPYKIKIFADGTTTPPSRSQKRT